MRFCSSASTTAPTSQNQDVMRAPCQMRLSQRKSLSSVVVDVTMFLSMARSGTDDGAGGIIRAASQPSTEITTMPPATSRNSNSLPDARLPPIVPSRIAMNVAPSINALPAGSWRVSSCDGSRPYFTGPKKALSVPKRMSAVNSIGSDGSRKPAAASRATGISISRTRVATSALSNLSAY